ncbi:hypothetical protein FDP41_004192 [Naegleria fowleri]|uniref:Uncharacterized protein n=1 Tax=Naegleria fowleri TaxID=5763 RepID=A0A6A5BIV3_NAEFO|nr:uncharacterized protein FDP41_004192 [Naegleria fowleri]KAF0976897.1 hypothetical protein FDP41_004192 [Naegleria fowleri]
MNANIYPNALFYSQHHQSPCSFSQQSDNSQQLEDPYLALMIQIQQHQQKQQMFAKVPTHQHSPHHIMSTTNCNSSQQNNTKRMQQTSQAFSNLSRNEFIELFLERVFMVEESPETSHPLNGKQCQQFLTMLSLPSAQVNTHPNCTNDATSLSSDNYTLIEDSLLLDNSNFMQNFREWLILSQQLQSLQSYL